MPERFECPDCETVHVGPTPMAKCPSCGWARTVLAAKPEGYAPLTLLGAPPLTLEQNKQANAIFQAVLGHRISREEAVQRLAELFGLDTVESALRET